MSTHAAAPARAQGDDGPPAEPEDAAGAGGGPAARDPLARPPDSAADSAADPKADAAAGRLVVPLDLDEASDSAFVRRLLLSHGIELELGEGGVLDRAAFVALVARLQRDGAGALVGADGAGLDVELVPDEAFDLTLALDVDEELSHFSADEGPGLGGWRRQRFLLEGVVLPVPGVPEPAAASPDPDAPPEAPSGEPPPDPVPVSAVSDCPVPQDLIDGFASTFDGRAPSADDAALHARLHEALAPSLEPVARAPLADGASEAWRTRWLACDIVLPVLPADGAPVAPEPVPEAPGGVGDPDGVTGAPPDVPELADAPAPAPSGSIFSISDELPPGFEGLGGPVDQFVDVYLNDRRIGTTGITVTVDEFEFDAVDEVVAMLDELEDVTPLLPVLGAPMRTNAERRCYATGDPPGCGTVETDTVAALYDEGSLRLDLFVAPSLMPVAGGGARYIPSPERSPSAILSLGLVASDTASQSALDAVGGVIVGFGDTHLSARADYTSRGNRSRLREARLTRFAGDYEYGLGSFGFSPGAGLLGTDLLGASVATSYRLRTDVERAFAPELVVYLPRRAVVRLLVDDRVYHADSYPAGNRVVDGSALPEGTYELEIRIVEDGVETRVERRLYTKSTDLPPPGQTVLALTAGLPLFFDETDPAPDAIVPPPDDAIAAPLGDGRFLPEVGDVPVFGASAERRLGERDALRIGVLQVGDVSVGQGEYVRLGRRYALELGVSAGGRGVRALGASALVFGGGWSASLAHASTRADASIGDDPDDGPTFERFFPRDSERTDLALARSFGRTQLGARLSRRRVEDEDREEQLSLFARRTLFRTARLGGSLEADWTADGDGGSRVGVRVRVDARGERLSGSAYLGASRVGDGPWGPAAGVGVSTGERTLGTARWSAGARADTEIDAHRLGVSAELEHPFFAAGASTDWTWSDATSDDPSRTSLASLRAQAGVDGDGVAVGGVDYATAGVIVDVRGTPRGEPFDIRIGGGDAGSAVVGSPRFVALRPFRTYRVDLVPRGVLSNGIGERTHEFTVFPGSVQRIEVEARREVLLIAALVDERGRAVVDATFETARGPVLIDSSGVFQAELPPGRSFTVTRDGAPVCEFEVPEPPGDDPILIPERPIGCRSVADAARQ